MYNNFSRCTSSGQIGYAHVPVNCAAEGTELQIEAPLGRLGATVCPWPWFPAEKRIPSF